MRRRVVIELLALLVAFNINAQQRHMGMLFYDVDRLYDTIPALFYDDSDFTPTGKMHWDSERYNLKIDLISSLLDSLQLPLVGLYGVESEEVVRDIQRSCEGDYSALHATRNSFDGMDFALLYYGDMFYVDTVEAQRDLLVIGGTYLDVPITMILARDGRDVESYLSENDCAETIIVAGDISRSDIRRWGFENLHSQAEAQGYGNCISRWGWYFKHRIAINRNGLEHQSGAYVARYLLLPNRQGLFPTFIKDNYLGGYSNYLPVYSYIYL